MPQVSQIATDFSIGLHLPLSRSVGPGIRRRNGRLFLVP